MYTAGRAPLTFTAAGVRFGCALGMETHYPELFTAYEQQDVDCVLFSTHGNAEFPGIFAVEAAGHAAANSFWAATPAPPRTTRRPPGWSPRTAPGPPGARPACRASPSAWSPPAQAPPPGCGAARPAAPSRASPDLVGDQHLHGGEPHAVPHDHGEAEHRLGRGDQDHRAREGQRQAMAAMSRLPLLGQAGPPGGPGFTASGRGDLVAQAGRRAPPVVGGEARSASMCRPGPRASAPSGSATLPQRIRTAHLALSAPRGEAACQLVSHRSTVGSPPSRLRRRPRASSRRLGTGARGHGRPGTGPIPVRGC
jgi:hypothetical protein